MKERLPKICSTSSDPRKGGCTCTDCVFNVNHYDPQPEDWIITHKANIVQQGKCLQEKGEE